MRPGHCRQAFSGQDGGWLTTAFSGQVRVFAAMITNLTGQDLPQWIAAARDAGL
jgi:hypothetical protein